MRTFRAWLPFAVAIIFCLGTVFMVGQQVLRQSANDPQVQLARDWAGNIAAGTEPNRLQLGQFMDPALSLAPFGIVYGPDGNILASSAAAPSSMPQPDGIFDELDDSPTHEKQFTWEPVTGQRYAAVITRATSQNKQYYVLAGRNLQEVERRVTQLRDLVLLGGALGLAGVLVAQHVHLAAHLLPSKRARKT